MAKSNDDDLTEIINAGDYGSEFEYDTEEERKRAKYNDLAQPESRTKTKLPRKKEVTAEYSKEEGRKERFHILSLDAFDRHKKLINDYLLYYGGSRSEFGRDSSHDKTDYDVIRENHQFLWDEEEDQPNSWEKRMAKKYYDKLFKEYCIVDLSRYKENKIALRWRTENEVVDSKGQFRCAEKHCQEEDDLRSWEVNFGYVEGGQKKNALVKVRLCPECSHKLNYYHRKKEIKRKRKSDVNDVGEELSKKQKPNVDKHAGKVDTKVKTSPFDAKSTSDVGSMENATSSTTAPPGDSTEQDVWKKSVPVTEEKSREDEFDDYFEDMFL